MKTKKSNSEKLSLKKETIAHLHYLEMSEIYGGETVMDALSHFKTKCYVNCPRSIMETCQGQQLKPE